MQPSAQPTQDLARERGIVTEMTHPTQPVAAPHRPAARRSVPARQFRYAIVAAVALVVFLVAWIVMRGDDSPSTSAAPGPARVVSASDLQSFAGGLDHPMYWAGRRDGMSYELTRTPDGRVFVRYLPEGTNAGDPHPDFLTVGTYPRATAFAELKRAAKAKGSVSVKLPNNGLMVFSNARPTSVYLGWPDAKYQVEVYDPSADAARRLVLSGQVQPVR